MLTVACWRHSRCELGESLEPSSYILDALTHPSAQHYGKRGWGAHICSPGSGRLGGAAKSAPSMQPSSSDEALLARLWLASFI